MSSSPSQELVVVGGPKTISPKSQFSVGSSSTCPVVVPETNEAAKDSVGADVEENPFAKKIRRKTSVVWSEFTEVMDCGVQKVQCIHCKLKLTKNKTGATTQYKRHLVHCVRRKVHQNSQLNLSVTPTVSLNPSNDIFLKSTITNWKYDHSMIRELTAHLILVHELPFNFVEYEMFNLLMKSASPHFEKISRTTVRNDCFTSYEIGKVKLKNLLDSVRRVSITTDLWKSNQDIQYMVLTCHFVDSDFTLQKRVINFVDIPPPHRATNVHDLMFKCFKEWGIENKVFTITVDNASYNTAAVMMLKSSLEFQQNKRLPLEGSFFHVRCCAHILNLLVQEGVSEIKSIIESVRDSVKYVTASQHRIVMFSAIAQQLHLPNKKLILDCVTRWNATYAMLVCALEFREVFPRFHDRDPLYTSCPDDEEWAKLEEVCSFLEAFKVATEIMSGSEYPTSNLFLSELWGIKEMLDDKCNNGPLYIRSMALKMKDKFDKYWGSSNILISIGSVLDPRVKLEVVEFAFKIIYPGNSEIKIEEVRFALFSLYAEYLEDFKLQQSSEKSQSESEFGSSSTAMPPINREKPVYGKKKFNTYFKTDFAINTVKSEQDVYLSDGVVFHDDTTGHFDCLAWWKVNSGKYRILSRMASDILSIPLTTVASEATFSAGGRTIDKYRSSLEFYYVLVIGIEATTVLKGKKRTRKRLKRLSFLEVLEMEKSGFCA